MTTFLDDLLAEATGVGTARFPTAGSLAHTIDPRTIQTPALDLIDAELEHVTGTPDARLILSMPPQEGKTQRCSRDLPIWALLRNPDLRIVTASYAQSLANRNGRAVRNAIATHPELGLTIARDNGSASEWQLEGHRGGMVSVGRGAGITGRPCDLLIIDDPLKDRAEADSQTIRDTCWDWWTDALSARLSPGAPVMVVSTRWHQDDLAGRLIDRDASAGWRVLNIPAQCETPDSDPLGREAGEFMQSARGRTREQWELRKATAGPRAWASLYQGHPSPAEGGIFRREWWQYWTTLPSLDGQIVQSWDLSFKDSDGSDYVVGQVWMKRGADAYLLDQVRGRWGFTDSRAQIMALSEKWPQATTKLIEDKANGPAVIDSLRSTLPGIVPVTPRESKQARAAAVEPFIAAGNVHIPAGAAWAGDLIEEAAGFPNAAHDDQCLTGETTITTPDGPKRLDQVRAGDTVRSATGWTTVEWAGCTGRNAQIVHNAGLSGTPNHPVLTSRGWTKLSLIERYDEVWTLAQSRIAPNPSSIPATDGAADATNGGGNSRSRGPIGPLRDARRWFSRAASAARFAASLRLDCAGRAGSAAPAPRSRLSNATASPSGATPTRSTPPTGPTSSRAETTSSEASRRSTARSTSAKWGPSRTATKCTTWTGTLPTTNPTTWWRSALRTIVRSPSRVGSVVEVLGETVKRCSITWKAFVSLHRNGTAPTKVSAGTLNTLEQPNSRRDVFNLRTTDGTFYANGVLVHNCDAMTQALAHLYLTGARRLGRF